ncbi:MAG: MBL fold metallo-hydrolase [Candidatus Omnitrophica bacterium]|nr:MBL fold metallo-hydrolase [Candidatus Omnitrophota bacterium]
MLIKVLFDKDREDEDLHIGWGVSFLVDDKILFDTGEKGEWLLENMRSLKVSVDNIEAIVISHDHWDHWGGLWDLLKIKKGIPLYICPNFSRDFKKKAKKLGARLIEIDKLAQILPDIFSTGEIAGVYHDKYMAEQAMVLRTKNGITVITGCAHPGILKIVEKINSKFQKEQIYLVFGGFHLMESDNRAIENVAENFKEMGIMKAGPTHCSGPEAERIFRAKYNNNFVSIKTGQVLNV